MYDLDDFTVDSMPCALKSFRDIDEACRRCEIHVKLTLHVHAYIRSRLDYDNRKKGYFGRVLLEDIPASVTGGQALLKWDRLEPSMTCMDIGQGFDSLVTFPTDVTFWRSSAQTSAVHRNPLWSEELGVTHDRVLAIDDLHTLALGVYAFFCSFLILLCFKADVWETREATEEARIARSVDRMKPELADCHRGLRRQGHRPTEIQELCPSMFGTASSPS